MPGRPLRSESTAQGPPMIVIRVDPSARIASIEANGRVMHLSDVECQLDQRLAEVEPGRKSFLVKVQIEGLHLSPVTESPA